MTRAIQPPPSGFFYRLDVEGLGRDLRALLSPCVSGYSLQLRQYGRALFDRREVDSARTPGGAAGLDIRRADARRQRQQVDHRDGADQAAAQPQHLAGCADRPWLPAHWQKGPGVERITFRQLLTHTSGLVVLNEPGHADFQFMKEQIALGRSAARAIAT